MKVLLAEDESKLATFVRNGLTEAGHTVDLAHDGLEAGWLAENGTYDIWLFDIMMPGRDGISLLRQLRRQGQQTPVILLSARGAVDDRVRGLDAGADDYLPKPFSLAELLARLRAISRRQRKEAVNVLRVEDLELDLIDRVAHRGKRRIELTNREWSLLELLMLASPKPVSKTAIIERVWDQHFDSGTNVVQVYIRYLREKLETPGEEPLIQTVRGVGYAIRKNRP